VVGPRAAAPATAPAQRTTESGPEEHPAVVFFDPGEYAGAVVEGWAGSEACAGCHEAEYRHWRRTPHARALDDAAGPDGAAPVNCRRCHASLVVVPEGDRERLALDSRAVGCESCHGPGLAHVADPEGVSGRISGVRDGCRECNFRRLCQVCHNSEGDPDFRYFAAYRLVTHPGPGEGGEGMIPLTGTGGPACGRPAER